MKRPCLICGKPSEGSRCVAHTPIREGSTTRPYNRKAWKRASLQARADTPYCERCGHSNPANLTADHIIPLSKGGDAVPGPEGIQVLCRACNSSKKGGWG
jgi:5-methylcytosine-specific restriction endonuclease McrA